MLPVLARLRRRDAFSKIVVFGFDYNTAIFFKFIASKKYILPFIQIHN